MEKVVDFGGQGTKNIVTILLIGLSLFTALILETKMSTHYTAELVIILIGLIFLAGVIFGLWIDAEWAYPLASVMFAVGLANLIWLFSATGAFLPFAFGLIVNVAGLVMCIVGTTSEPSSVQRLETYDIDEIKQELNQIRAARASKKKTKRKTKKSRKRKTKKRRR